MEKPTERGRPKNTGHEGEIKYFNDYQLEKFMNAVKQSKRDDFLFSLMLYVGARVVEITNLKLDDVDEDSKEVRIHGVKKGNTRRYEMSGKLWRKCQRWMKERNKIKDSDRNPYLFITNRGNYDEGISRIGLQWLFRDYCKKVGLNGFYPHALRHTCAIQKVKNGHSAVYVMKWLRQKKITTAQRYMDIAGEEIKQDELRTQQIFNKFF